MDRPIDRFFLLSLIIHLFLFQLSGLIFVMPERPASDPVRIHVIDQTPEVNKDVKQGRVEDLPKPVKEEKPSRQEILSRFDSKAHSPEKGKEHKSPETVMPRERIDAPAPTVEKAKEVAPPQKPEVAEKKIALPRPNLDLRKPNAEKEFNPFSNDVMRQALNTAPSEWGAKSEAVRNPASPKPSDEPTEKPNLTPQEKIQVSGLTGVQGSDLGKYAVSETGDVVDLGDEAVVSLNTTSFEYMDYFTSIKKAVELVWTYPEDAIMQGLSGRTVLRFTLKNTGELEDVRLLRSSGHKSLDDEAQLAVKVAAPYNAFPAELGKKRIHIVATFVYQPTFNFVK